MRQPAGRRALVWSVSAAALVAYVVGAALSGHLSLIARRPILDGVGPPPPYNWVDPPPELADTNQEPPGAEEIVRLGPKGSKAKVLTTSDGQFTFVMRAQLFAPHPGAKQVVVRAEPEDTSKFEPPPGGLDFTGNSYLLTATYEPGGDRVERLEFNAVGVLVYPVFVNLHAPEHQLFLSTDGKTWQQLDSTDVPGLVQVQATVPALGHLVVGAKLRPAASGSPSPEPGGAASTRNWLLVGLAVLVVGLALVLSFIRRTRR
jgi:hypothetical protein